MKHEKKLKEYEAVWTCDFCGKESKTKKESDKHELVCEKNPDSISFPFNRNIKKSWLVLWITTMVVFGITVFINSNLFSQGLNLFDKKWFLNLFFVNIIIGIVAFLGMVFTENKNKKKIIPIIKYSFVICLFYCLFNVGAVLSVKNTFQEQKQKSDYLTYQEPTPKTELQNIKYNGKVISGTVVNKSDKPIFNSKVVLKISKDRTAWEIDETHEFIVPYKIDPNQSINFSENYKTTKKDPWWTTLIQESHFYNNENVPTPSPTARPKPTTVMVNCLISAECGGGSKLLAKSICDNSTCCQITGKGWIFYQNKNDCVRDQNIANGTQVKTVVPTTASQINNTNYPPCIVYYPLLKYSQTYYIPPEQCKQWQDSALSQSMQPTISSQNNSTKDYSSICNSQYQLELQKANTYGGSVADAIRDIAKTNLSNCLKNGEVQNINIQQNPPSPTPTIVGIYYN